MRTLLSGLALTLCAGTPAYSQPAPRLLRLDPVVGSVARYEMVAEGGAGTPAHMRLFMRSTQRVLERAGDAYRLVVTVDSQSALVNGQTMAVPAEPPDTMLVSRAYGQPDSSGRVVNVFPERAVSVGDSWTDSAAVVTESRFVSEHADSLGHVIVTISQRDSSVLADSSGSLLPGLIMARGIIETVLTFDLTAGLLLEHRSTIRTMTQFSEMPGLSAPYEIVTTIRLLP